MTQKINYIGKRFDKLVVIEECGKTEHGDRQYLCKCDCGNTTIVANYVFQRNGYKSCGCMRGVREDITGQRFGMLTVLGREKFNGSYKWKCLCDCGNITYCMASSLMTGHKTSCGCYGRDRLGNDNRTHGQTGSRLFKIYHGIKARCYNKNFNEYDRYGGRGIGLCKEWLDNPQSFFDWSLQNGYNDDLTIDRIDNNGNYSPENCRWITRKEQNSNTSRNVIYEYNGEALNLSRICEKYGINYSTIRKRLKCGMSIKEAVETPINKSYSRSKRGMKIPAKRTSTDVVMPKYASVGAAGMDLCANITGHVDIKPGEVEMIDTGIAMELPEGYFGAIYARSGLATKRGLRPANCVGIIDGDFRGTIVIPLYNDSDVVRTISPQERIAQLIIQPYCVDVEFVDVDDLSDTERGEGGFGSTGSN